MSAIVLNKARVSRFTSSQISRLMTNGKGPGGIGAPAVTYINEKNLETKLGRSLDIDVSSRDIAWGNFMEKIVFDLLDFDYELCSDQTFIHPTINCWSGSPDLKIDGVKIGEIKCYQPKKFALYTDALLTGDVKIIRDGFPEEYWQAVSNAIIHKVDKAELITYMPYRSELLRIREIAFDYDGEDQWRYKFIAEGEDSQLAYLPDGGYYKNLNRFEFEVPQEDIKALTERIKFCQTLLIDIKK